MEETVEASSLPSFPYLLTKRIGSLHLPQVPVVAGKNDAREQGTHHLLVVCMYVCMYIHTYSTWATALLGAYPHDGNAGDTASQSDQLTRINNDK
jgi:hypothetical protein